MFHANLNLFELKFDLGPWVKLVFSVRMIPALRSSKRFVLFS